MDQDPYSLPDDATERIIPHLNKEKGLVVLAIESPEVYRDALSNSH